MTYSMHSLLRSSLSLSFAGLLAGLFASACDLPDKNLGDDDTTSAGATTEGGTCEPGQTMMMDCNTCSCEDGQWACTEIGCDPTAGSDGTTQGGTCDPAEDPSDECNSCACEDGQWLCTAIGCDPTAGSDTDPGGCDPALDPSNGCNVCSCEDGAWSCPEVECQYPLEICSGAEPTDPLTVLDASIAGDVLQVSVSHGGGCVAHDYGSCWDGSFAESEPVQAWLQLDHEDNDDACDAIVMEALSIDLTPMRDAWIDAYLQPSGTITLHVADWGSLDYSF